VGGSGNKKGRKGFSTVKKALLTGGNADRKTQRQKKKSLQNNKTGRKEVKGGKGTRCGKSTNHPDVAKKKMQPTLRPGELWVKK